MIEKPGTGAVSRNVITSDQTKKAKALLGRIIVIENQIKDYEKTPQTKVKADAYKALQDELKKINDELAALKKQLSEAKDQNTPEAKALESTLSEIETKTAAATKKTEALPHEDAPNSTTPSNGGASASPSTEATTPTSPEESNNNSTSENVNPTDPIQNSGSSASQNSGSGAGVDPTKTSSQNKNPTSTANGSGGAHPATTGTTVTTPPNQTNPSDTLNKSKSTPPVQVNAATDSLAVIKPSTDSLKVIVPGIVVGSSLVDLGKNNAAIEDRLKKMETQLSDPKSTPQDLKKAQATIAADEAALKNLEDGFQKLPATDKNSPAGQKIQASIHEHKAKIAKLKAQAAAQKIKTLETALDDLQKEKNKTQANLPPEKLANLNNELNEAKKDLEAAQKHFDTLTPEEKKLRDAQSAQSVLSQNKPKPKALEDKINSLGKTPDNKPTPNTQNPTDTTKAATPKPTQPNPKENAGAGIHKENNPSQGIPPPNTFIIANKPTQTDTLKNKPLPQNTLPTVSAGVSEAENKLNEVSSKLKNLEAKINDPKIRSNAQELSKAKADLAGVQADLKNIEAAYQKLPTPEKSSAQGKKVQTSINANKSKIAKLKSKLSPPTDSVGKVERDIAQLKNEIEKIESLTPEYKEIAQAKLEAMEKRLSKLENTLRGEGEQHAFNTALNHLKDVHNQLNPHWANLNGDTITRKQDALPPPSMPHPVDSFLSGHPKLKTYKYFESLLIIKPSSRIELDIKFIKKVPASYKIESLDVTHKNKKKFYGFDDKAYYVSFDAKEFDNGYYYVCACSKSDEEQTLTTDIDPIYISKPVRNRKPTPYMSFHLRPRQSKLLFAFEKSAEGHFKLMDSKYNPCE